jgi:hypothetical protein
MDSQTWFKAVNAALARETHSEKTTREVVGDVAGWMEPAYEKVLRTGKPDVELEITHTSFPLKHFSRT